MCYQQVTIRRVTMWGLIKQGNYSHDYHHKQSQYVVKEYSRYRIITGWNADLHESKVVHDLNDADSVLTNSRALTVRSFTGKMKPYS